MTMSAVDFLDQWFETDVLKATMSASGIIGTFLGVRSPGTAYVLLHHYMGEIDGAFRSWGLVARRHRRDLERDRRPRRARPAPRSGPKTAVSKIIVKDGAAVGVVLENGDYLTASVVSSSVDPHLTFLKMVGAEHLPDEFVDRRAALQVPRLVGQGEPRARRAARLHVRCPAPARICAARSRFRRASTTWSAPTTTRSTAAFSRRPYIDIVIPSLTDPSVAPPGKHVMSCFVQYAPYHLKEGTWDDQREAFGDTVDQHASPSTRRTSATSSCTARCSRRSTSSASGA